MDEYEEYLAKFIVEDYLPQFGKFSKNEHPDFVNNKHRIGLEVTNAGDPKILEFYSLWTKGKLLSGRDTVELKTEFGFYIAYSDHIVGTLEYDPTDKFIYELEFVTDIIRKKREKLLSYDNMLYNILFIYSNMNINLEYMKYMKDWRFLKSQSLDFDCFVIFNIRDEAFCTIINNQINIHKIDVSMVQRKSINYVKENHNKQES